MDWTIPAILATLTVGLVLIRLRRLAFAVALLGSIAIAVDLAGGKAGLMNESAIRYVDITFEIQATGAKAEYSYGADGDMRSSGLMSEGLESKTLHLPLGTAVSAHALAVPGRFGFTTRSHRLICRIKQNGHQLYLQADAGTPYEPAEVFCGSI